MKVRVPKDLYNEYMKEGLFDKNHTAGKFSSYDMSTVLISHLKYLGNPYLWDGKLLESEYKEMRVNFHGGELKAYTIIKAKVPSSWTTGPIVSLLSLPTIN